LRSLYAGLGKTLFAELVAKAREKIHGKEHRFIQVPVGTSRAEFIKIMAKDATYRPATVFFDECQHLPVATRNTIKPLIETGGNLKDVQLSEQCVFPANPFQHLYIFASNEDLVSKDSALWGQSGRTSPVHFVPYSETEKADLIRFSLKGSESLPIAIDADAVAFLCGRVWANARAITQEMGSELRQKAIIHGGKITLAFAKAFCAGELHEGLSEETRKQVKRYPRGLVWDDIRALQYMDANAKKGVLVSEIANFINQPRKDASYKLQWLASEGLTVTGSNGRKMLSLAGAQYLAAYKESEARREGAKRAQATKAQAVEAKASAKPAKETAKAKAKAKPAKEKAKANA
jgi:hypothetical protein